MKTTVIFAACREYKTEPATNAMWFQTFPPYGRYPVSGTVKGAAPDAEFVFDEAAAKAIIDAFRAAAKDPAWPGILVDEEHYSLDRSKSSAAMAWAKDIRQDADGSIWTRWEFTPKGRELWVPNWLDNLVYGDERRGRAPVLLRPLDEIGIFERVRVAGGVLRLGGFRGCVAVSCIFDITPRQPIVLFNSGLKALLPNAVKICYTIFSDLEGIGGQRL